MYKVCTLVSFTSLLVLLSFSENYGYFKNVYIELSNQTAVNERLMSQSAAGGWTMEVVERVAMALMVCVTSVFFWRDYNHYRSLYGQDTKSEIGTKLVSLKRELEEKLRSLEDKIDELSMRHPLEEQKSICLPPVVERLVPITSSDLETEMKFCQVLPSSEDVETIYSRPASSGGRVQQEQSATLTHEVYCQIEPQALGAEKSSQTSCSRLDLQEADTRSVFSLPAATRVGTGDVPATPSRAASWYEEVQQEEAQYKYQESAGEVDYRRTPRYEGQKKGYAAMYRRGAERPSNEPLAPETQARTSRPTTPRHPGPPAGPEAASRRRRQRNYNPK